MTEKQNVATDTTDATRQAIEAAVFRRLLAHFQTRTDMQNIDLMNLAGGAAAEQGVEVSDAEARERVYGMPYDEWKRLHQREAPPSQLDAFSRNKPGD